jgi:glucose/arabinose dehydrogenase
MSTRRFVPRAVAVLGAAVAVPALLVSHASAAPALVSVGTFESPVYVTGPPGDTTRLFVVERAGRIRLIKNGTPVVTPFLDISSIVKIVGGGGLLSIAFPPTYSSNGRFYALYTDAVGIRLAEFRTVSSDQATTSNSRILLTQPHSAAQDHYGGQLQFGPDNLLYISIGDGRDGGDNASNLGSWWGKLMRIDPTAANGSPYQVPTSNPFSATAGAKREIWASGLRNPWRFSFDRDTGDLVIGDVGQARADEIDFAPATSGGGRGANYGWNCFEGLEPYSGRDVADVLRN